MYYFIVNPASGSGRGRLVWETIEKELDRLRTEYHAYILSGRGEARKLAQGLSKLSHPATIVAVGGDGTINEIINGLSSFENITFACIPTGSGNDFVRGLGLSTSPLEALHRILNPKEIRDINIGQSNEASFTVSSGLGFDAAVCHEILDSRLRKILNLFRCGKLAYLLIALRQLFTMKRHTLLVTPDDAPGMTFPDSYFAAVMNLPYEGGGFYFCPDAQPDDDFLDLIVASGISRIRALFLLPLALRGKHVGHKGIRIIRCQKAVVSSDSPLCTHTDGEITGFHNKVSFRLKSRKLPVIYR